MRDLIVEEVRRVREELIERYGGIDGYFRHCQAQERASAGRSRRRKGPPASGRTSRARANPDQSRAR